MLPATAPLGTLPETLKASWPHYVAWPFSITIGRSRSRSKGDRDGEGAGNRHAEPGN
jgi:hypothetical protein